MEEVVRKNVANLTSLFQGAATIVAIQIPFLDSASPSPSELDAIKNIIQDASNELLYDGCLIVPGSDGFLIVSDQATDEVARQNTSELAETIRRNTEASNLPSLIDFQGIQVQSMAAGNTTRHNVDINHEHFLSLSPELRMQTLSDLSLNVAEDKICVVTARNLKDSSLNERFLEYPLVPRSKQAVQAYRDSYFEPDPVCTSIDLIMLRKAAFEVMDSLERGDASRITAPVNLMSIADSRYWRAYENELRNIPEFVRKLVGLQLVRISAGAPVGKVEDVLMRARPAVGHIYVSLDLDWEHWAPDLLMGLDGISVSFPPENRRSQTPAVMVDKMKRLFEKFRRDDIQLIAQNIPSQYTRRVLQFCEPDLITLPACDRETPVDDNDAPNIMYV